MQVYCDRGGHRRKVWTFSRHHNQWVSPLLAAGDFGPLPELRCGRCGRNTVRTTEAKLTRALNVFHGHGVDQVRLAELNEAVTRP